ncbi:MAG: cysteine-rich small domain-containing protein [Candidatus Nanoarchaeia archaeon]|nr:cysteine-rich small domain-containing protein [Candidatus Nanoarchaeia archaeon]MDD5741536.1 cysteine-rich small domain-containing protein [Candidatus Nanoarchaeia archaeon]
MEEIKQFFKNRLEETLRELKKQKIELTINNIPLIIRKTDFKIRSKEHPEKCKCYQTQIPCHDLENLNCFLCGCPEYLSESPTGGCNLNSNLGEYIPYDKSPEGKLWACDGCTYPHHPENVEKYLKANMKQLRQISDKL